MGAVKVRGGNLLSFTAYLLHYGPGEGCVRAVQNLSHQHWFEEGPRDGSSCGVDHVQVHVHTEGS